MNRITKMIATVEAKVASQNLTPEQMEKHSRSLDMSPSEHADLQNRKSAAMGGDLTTEEAQTAYQYLGETVSTFNSQSVAVKYVLSKLHAELLERGMKHVGRRSVSL